MGLLSYFRIFFEGFSRNVLPITYLEKKGIKFQWMVKFSSIEGVT